MADTVVKNIHSKVLLLGLEHVKWCSKCEVPHNIKTEEVKKLRDIQWLSLIALDSIYQLLDIDKLSLFEIPEG